MGSDQMRNYKISDAGSSADRGVFGNLVYPAAETHINGDSGKNRRKRKHERYKVKDFALVMLKSESKVDIGQMLDISEGGLSFQYVARDEQLSDYATFNISMISDDFFSINRIPFKSVSDINLTDASLFKLKKLRRHSLKFGDLTSRQSSKIEYFLLNYTSCKA